MIYLEPWLFIALGFAAGWFFCSLLTCNREIPVAKWPSWLVRLK